MRCSELSVPMHEYLGTKYKVQVSNVDSFDVWNKRFAVYKRTIVISVSGNKDLLQQKEKEKGEENN